MVKVTLIKSLNGQVAGVKATCAALGLKKIRQSKTFEETPANLGKGLRSNNENRYFIARRRRKNGIKKTWQRYRLGLGQDLR